MTTTQLTAAKRIAAVLRAGKREVTPEQAAARVERMREKFEQGQSMVCRVNSDSFAEAMAYAVEDGQPKWTAALHREFGEPL